MDEQLRLTDFVPRKYPTLLLWFLAGVTMVAGLEALYAWMPEIAKNTTDGRIAAFDLDSEGSLGAWFSSFILQLAAGMALLVFLVRRQKADDYHGRYRIWVWAAVCWQVMCIDESASLHEGFKELMTISTGQRVLGDGSIWWVLAYALVLGAVGIRLLLEMRVCRTSTTSLVVAGLCFAAAVIVQLGGLLPDLGARAVMVEEGCEMAGGLFLLLSMTLHARYAVLEAQGQSASRTKPRRQRKKAAESTDAPTAASEQSTAADKTEAATRTRVKATPSPVTTAQGDSVRKPQATITASRPDTRIDPAETGVPAPRMSKAERRALRKQKQRDSDSDLD